MNEIEAIAVEDSIASNPVDFLLGDSTTSLPVPVSIAKKSASSDKQILKFRNKREGLATWSMDGIGGQSIIDTIGFAPDREIISRGSEAEQRSYCRYIDGGAYVQATGNTVGGRPINDFEFFAFNGGFQLQGGIGHSGESRYRSDVSGNLRLKIYEQFAFSPETEPLTILMVPRMHKQFEGQPEENTGAGLVSFYQDSNSRFLFEFAIDNQPRGILFQHILHNEFSDVVRPGELVRMEVRHDLFLTTISGGLTIGGAVMAYGVTSFS